MAFRTVTNKFLFFKPPTVWYCVIAAKWTKTNGVCMCVLLSDVLWFACHLGESQNIFSMQTSFMLSDNIATYKSLKGFTGEVPSFLSLPMLCYSTLIPPLMGWSCPRLMTGSQLVPACHMELAPGAELS